VAKAARREKNLPEIEKEEEASSVERHHHQVHWKKKRIKGFRP